MPGDMLYVNGLTHSHDSVFSASPIEPAWPLGKVSETIQLMTGWIRVAASASQVIDFQTLFLHGCVFRLCVDVPHHTRIITCMVMMGLPAMVVFIRHFHHIVNVLTQNGSCLEAAHFSHFCQKAPTSFVYKMNEI